jgi:hypothetical protein
VFVVGDVEVGQDFGLVLLSLVLRRDEERVDL